jgi:hypothetical protein
VDANADQPPQDDPDEGDSVDAEEPDRDAIEAWLDGDAGTVPDLSALVPDGGIVFRAPIPSCACKVGPRRVQEGGVPLVLASLSLLLAVWRRAPTRKRSFER